MKQKHDQVLRIESLSEKKKRNAILSAAKHNLRELPPEPHIDPERSDLNRVLYGTENAAEVAQRAKAMMAERGIKPRAVNTIRAVEVLVCLPVNFSGDALAFFDDALAWADEFFQVPVLSAIAHFDEDNPHMHILLLPLVDGKLDGSGVMGDLKRIQAMQADFYASVGKRYGLRRKAAVRRSKADRRNAAQKIMDAVIANPALLNGGQVKHMLLDLIAQNVDAFAGSMGIELPEPEITKSFAEIMTKPQRPERKKKPIEVRQEPIGVAQPVAMPENSGKTGDSYALIEVRNSARAQLVPAVQLAADHDQVSDGDFERVRDDPQTAGYWCETRGEWVTYPVKSSRKLTAILPQRVA